MSKKRSDGEIAVYYPDKRFGFLTTTSGERLFFHEHDVRADWRGSTAWSRIPGTPVTFLVTHKTSKGQLLVAADDVAPVFVEPQGEDLEAYREVSRVRSWNGCFGWLTRECESSLFFHRNAIIQGRPSDVQAGNFLFHGVVQEKNGKFKASEIQLYSPAEQNRLQQGLPPYEVETESVSELLTPVNRNKTLLELVQEKQQ